MRKKGLIIFINLLVIVAIVLYVLNYSFAQRADSVTAQKESFMSTMEVMSQISSNYLTSCQTICNNWALFINAGTYTMAQAMQSLNNMNSDSDVTIQFLYTDSLSGISSVPKISNPNDYTVKYTSTYGTLYDELVSLANDPTKEFVNVTRNFTNPADGTFVVAFCDKVTLYNEQAERYSALLLMLEPRDTITKHWVFPVGFNNAEIAMTDAKGEYIIRSDAMKSENFFEFIRAYNGLTYPESEQLRLDFIKADHGGIQYLNSAGEPTYFAYTHINNNKNWLLIGAIPVSSLNTSQLQWSLLIVTCAGFLILILFNSFYFSFLNKKLTYSLQEAKRANRAKTVFLSSMSHDIRTPMNAIVGMTEIAQQSIDDPNQVKDCLNKIKLASNHLLALINDILDISRIESGKVRLSPAGFSLVGAMQNLIKMMYTQLRDKQLRFDIHLENIFSEYVFADELRISQIWINLLSNAIKYTEDGGRIVLTLREEAMPEGDQNLRLVFRMADTGIGMTPEFLKTIYDPFTRAADSRTDTTQGSGLGMAIVKQIVDMMHGSISIESKPGKGSVFTVTLDVPPASYEIKKSGYTDKKVLVADEDQEVAQNAVLVLNELGSSADTADNAQDTAERIDAAQKQSKPYDIIFADQRLFSSPDAVRTLCHTAGTSVPVVLTAYYSSSLEENEANAGVADHLMKPYFRSVLQHELDMVFNKNFEPDELPVQKDFSGLQILVAEDNLLNWEILNKMLSFYHIATVHAQNGKECVDMLTEAGEDTYDMILMDIQMPVMNGLDATAAIRSLEDTAKAHIPIIAMTADAFAEDVENCLAAGMNAHIAKPVNMNKLIAEIETYSNNERKNCK